MAKRRQLSAIRDLQGKVVIITGASSGVGRAAALAFARHATRLVLAARRLETLHELAKECKSVGAVAISVQTDVTDANAVRKLAEAAVETFGCIDIWVNNAGVLAVGEFTATPVEVHDQVIRTNLMGYVHGAHAVLPYFKSKKQGIIINNISVGGWFPTPYAAGYTASKFGLRGFSEALRGELSRYPDIHVCDLFPAFLDTPGIQHAGNYSGSVLKPAPPVYDPQKVAAAMVAVARRPRRSTVVGFMANFLRLAHFIFPAISRGITARVMETYFKVADSTPPNSGNLFAPLEFGTSIHGGWSKQSAPRKKGSAILLASGIAVGLLLFAGKKSSKLSGLTRK